MAVETWSPNFALFGGGYSAKPPGEGWAQTGTKRVQTYAAPKQGGPMYRTVPVYSRYDPTELLQGIQQNQQAFQQQMAATAAKTQEDIAKQLQIVQTEKSAVAKMQEDYSKMLMEEADAKRKAQEEAALSLRTSQANLARQQMTPNLQIQPASDVPRTAGTQGFKRRMRAPMPLIQTTSGINVPTSNVLNV